MLITNTFLSTNLKFPENLNTVRECRKHLRCVFAVQI